MRPIPELAPVTTTILFKKNEGSLGSLTVVCYIIIKYNLQYKTEIITLLQRFSIKTQLNRLHASFIRSLLQQFPSQIRVLFQ